LTPLRKRIPLDVSGWKKFKIDVRGDHLCTCTTHSGDKKSHNKVFFGGIIHQKVNWTKGNLSKEENLGGETWKGSLHEVLCFFFEEITRELNKILIYECRCDERLRDKSERWSPKKCHGSGTVNHSTTRPKTKIKPSRNTPYLFIMK
jgi:hypothetical protein